MVMSIIPWPFRPKNSIPELDFAGTIAGLGSAIGSSSRFKVGAKVFGCLSMKDMLAGKGTLTEYICVEATEIVIAAVPDGLELEQAAGFCGCGISALRMVQRAGIKDGDRVLVNGASGGAGTMAVQIARAMGARVVVGICSGRNVELVRSLGVDEVIDYQVNHPVDKYIAQQYSDHPFDIVLDTIGSQDLFVSSPKYLKESGVFVNIGSYEGSLWTIWCVMQNKMRPRILGGVPRRYDFFGTTPDSASAEILAGFARDGKLRAVVDRVFKMEDVFEAYDLLLSKRARGKIIIKIQDLDN